MKVNHEMPHVPEDSAHVKDQTRMYFIRILGVDPNDADAVRSFRERMAFLEMREKLLVEGRKKRAVFIVAIASAALAALIPGFIQWLISSISFHRAGG